MQLFTGSLHAFLQGYRRYGPVQVPSWAADAYYAETRRIAVALGAHEVPASEHAVMAYLDRVRGHLRYDRRSHEVLAVLQAIRLPVPMAVASRELFLHAGGALLPDWAQSMLHRSKLMRLRDHVASASLRWLAPAFRNALKDGVAARSCRRMGLDPALLREFPPPPS